jgi:transcriptional regulator with XRE-family HTH domain
MTRQILNHNRIAMARFELNLSQRDVALEVGIHPVTMSRLEQGRNDETLTLGTIQRLAAALGLSISTLFWPPEANEQPEDPTQDECRLEALLWDARTAVSADDIAVAFGWTLRRVHTALSALEGRLAGRGTAIFSSGRRHRLTARSDMLTSQERERLERARSVRYGLMLHEALILQQVRRGAPALELAHLSGKERVAMGSLLKAGLIHVSGGRIELTEDAKFSLDTKPPRRG